MFSDKFSEDVSDELFDKVFDEPFDHVADELIVNVVDELYIKMFDELISVRASFSLRSLWVSFTWPFVSFRRTEIFVLPRLFPF